MGTVYYQDLEIDWAKATKEYVFKDFKNKDDLDKNNDYLYREQLKQLLNWTENYVESSEDNKNINNIFSVIGDRGTGKSSFVQSAEGALKKRAWTEKEKKQDIYPLPKIDPTIFDGKINILELFVAMLKSKVDEIVLKNEKQDNQEFQNIARFNKGVKEIISVLKNMRVDKSAFAEKNSGVEVLATLQEQQNFFEKISELISFFLLIVETAETKYTHISLSIDDLDLVPNGEVYNTLQNIFKFLKYQQSLIIFIAFRKEQLINSVMDALIKENSELLAHKEMDIAELREQAANFIEKGLPRPQQVVLEVEQKTKVLDILQPFIDLNQKEKLVKLCTRLSYGKSKDLTFRQFIQNAIMEQVRIQIDPVDAFELTRFVYPANLRGILQLLEIIHQFDNYQKLVDGVSTQLNSCLPSLQNNVVKYRQYFFNVLSETLPKSLHEIVLEWHSREYAARNSFICTKLLSSVGSTISENMRDQFEVIKNKQSYNVSLGDVFSVFELYKRQNNHSEDKLYFLYAMKIAYSIEMLHCLVNSMMKFDKIEKENMNDEMILRKIELDNYFALAKGKIIPDSFYYNDKIVSGENKVVYSEDKKDNIFQIIYSDISADGDIRKANLQVHNYQQKGHQYQYRNVFRKSDFEKNHHYLVDLFSQLTDINSVINKLYAVCRMDIKSYLFYSMFDLDFFIRKNYSRRSFSSSNSGIEHAIKRVNDCFTGDLNVFEEKEMQKKMVLPICIKNSQLEHDDKRGFDPLLKNVEETSNLIESIIPEEISGITASPEEDIKKVTKEELLKLRDMLNLAVSDNHVRTKRDVAKEYHKTFGLWPSLLQKEEIDLMNRFIATSRSQKFPTLNNNLKQLRNYLNGLNSMLTKKEDDENKKEISEVTSEDSNE
ncbi:hypothetical protein [Enterococcus sp. DIV0756]|uniref:hypothetical protein n=1 Tax=Enterococcus sp. DIV0756 TaxID=2774636 RepID=UPI003F1FC941